MIYGSLEEFQSFYMSAGGNGLAIDNILMPPGYNKNTKKFMYLDGNYGYTIYEIDSEMKSSEYYYETFEDEQGYSDYSQCDSTKYKDFTENYKPLWFYEINQENLEKITNDYLNNFYDYSDDSCYEDFSKRLNQMDALY